MADWEVVYRATADFADLMQAAARAREAIKQLQDQAREEGNVESEAALKAAAAHEVDTRAIDSNRQALERQADSAAKSNVQTIFGGRSSMDQHLSDLDKEKEKKDLLNKSEWMGFSSPQQAESFRQQVYQQQLLRNKAAQMGYSSPDQYLNYMDQERSRTDALTASTKAHAAQVREEADAYTAHANAINEVHDNTRQLGQGGGAQQNISGYSAALAGLPDEVSTKVSFDDAQAIMDLATWREAINSIPDAVTTTARLDTTQLMADIAKAKAELSALPASQRIDATAAMGTHELAAPSQFTADAQGRLHDAQGHYVSAAAVAAAQAAAAPPQQEISPALAPRLGGVAGPSSMTAYGIQRRNEQLYRMAQPEASSMGDALRQNMAGYSGGTAGPSMLTSGGIDQINRNLTAFAHPEAATLGAQASSMAGMAMGAARAAGPAAGPSVALQGGDKVLSDIERIKTAIRALSHEIASPNVDIDSKEAVASLQQIRTAIAGVQQATKGLSIQPEGLNEVEKSFASLQAQAGRAFEDLSQSGGEGAKSVGDRWREAGSTIADVFRTMKATGEDAAQETGGVFQALGSQIAAAFKGISGSDLVGVFGALARAAAASGSAVVSSIGPMIATFLALTQLLPPLVAGMGALGTVFAAMPESVAAVATVMATLKTAIDPVVQALSAYTQVLDAMQSAAANPLETAMQTAQQQNALANAYYQVSQAAYQATQSQLQNAHSVSDAQFSVSQAAYQASMSQIEDAHAVEDAQYSLSQAQFEAGIQQTQSAMSVAEAQHSLADADYATQQAQYQLNIAWQTASEDLASLELQVTGASVNLRSAQLSLEQAQQNYATVMAQSTSTALDRAQAANQIQLAELALQQVEQQNTDNETQLADVRKYGAAQVFGVTQATQAYTDATFSQGQAQESLIVTEKEAANAQIQAAHEISDAVFSLWEAQQQQSNDFIVNAHDQSDAAFSLSQAQAAQGEGYVTSAHDQTQAQFELQQAIDTTALGLPSVASAEENLATAMYKLGPAAKEAVLDLEPLAAWFATNKSIGQAFFSEMLPSLGRVGALVGPLNTYLTQSAKTLGSLANTALTDFENLAHSDGWKILTGGAISIIHSLGMAVIYVAGGFTKLAEVATPFTTWLMHGIEDLAKRFDDWATNADKAGSNFSRWLTAVKPALDDIGHLVKAIVDGFKEIAGGPMGSSGSLSALKSFEDILTGLSKNILPAFFTALGILSQPAITAALTQMFVALSNLLLLVVKTPGFQIGFHAVVLVLIALADAMAKVMAIHGIADLIGGLTGAVLAFAAVSAALKFTGILSLITNFQNLSKYAQQAYGWASKVLEKVSGGNWTLPGAGGGTPAEQESDATKMTTAADTQGTAATKMVTASEAMERAADKMSTAADTQETAADTQETAAGAKDLGGAGAAASGVEEGTESAEDAEGGVIAAGFLTKLKTGISGLGLGLAAAFLQFATSYHFSALGNKTLWQTGNAPSQDKSIGSQFGAAFSTGPGSTAGNSWAVDYQDANAAFLKYVQDPVQRFFTTDMKQWIEGIGGPQWWTDANQWFVRDIQTPLGNFFTQMIPGWWDSLGQWWQNLWSGNMSAFKTQLWDPVANFFTNTIPGMWDSLGSWWDSLWSGNVASFRSEIVSPLTSFFTNSIPQFWDKLGTDWQSLWSEAQAEFRTQIWDPVQQFFTDKIPGFFTSMYSDFISKIASPMGHWFETSLPNSIESAFKNSVNWVITNVINKTIGFVNDVTKILDIPAIGKVQTLATGGNVMGGSVSGADDTDSQHAMLTPGEFVIRKPARMALEQQFGSSFLTSYINQADKVLGGQQLYMGGGTVSANAPVMAFAAGGSVGSIDTFLEGLAGKVPYVWGGVGPNGYDCSGLTGEVYARLLGFPDFRRYFVTQTFGSNQSAADLGFKPGLGKYTVGVNPATHMVGNLGGLKFEARDTQDGIVVGGNATDVRSMQKQFYLANAGTGFSDSGGTGGILGAIEGVGGALTSAGKNLLGVIGGSASSLLGLAGQGAEALFNAGWSKLVQPLASKLTGGSVTGAVGQAALGTIKSGVDKVLGQADAGSSNGPTSGSASQAQSYARSQLGRFGWGAGQMSPLISLWNDESGWNRFARNPESGAYGIPQALPGSKMGPAANPPESSMSSQVNWGLGYIQGRYGSPAGALAHENAYHWYAMGGPVGGMPGASNLHKPQGNPDVDFMALFHPQGQKAVAQKLFTGGDVINAIKENIVRTDVREAMLTGAQLASDMDPNLVKGNYAGAFQIDLAKHKDITKSEAENPTDAVKYLRESFQEGISKSGWGKGAASAELAAYYALTPGESYYASAGTSAVNTAYADALKDLGIKGMSSTGAPTAEGGSTGGDAAQTYATLTSELAKSVTATRNAGDSFLTWTPNAKTVPKGSSGWAGWYAASKILREEQLRTLGVGNDTSSVYADLTGAGPSLTEANWDSLVNRLQEYDQWLTGTAIPRAYWEWEKDDATWPKLDKGISPVGEIGPSLGEYRKNDAGQLATLQKDLGLRTGTGLTSLAAQTEVAWAALYGPGGSDVAVTATPTGGLTPGPAVVPSGVQPDPTFYDLQPAVTAGGPATPVYADGGAVGRMFSPGFAMGGSVPNYGPIPSALGTPASGVMPARGVSDAAKATGAGGTSIGMQLNGDINVHNPLPERAGDSIAHRTQRLSFLAGRGMG